MNTFEFNAETASHANILNFDVQVWVNDGKPAEVCAQKTDGSKTIWYVFLQEIPTGHYTGRTRFVLQTKVHDKYGTLLKCTYLPSDWSDSQHLTHDMAYRLFKTLREAVQH